MIEDGSNELNETKKDDDLSPKQKRSFVKMLAKFIRCIGKKIKVFSVNEILRSYFIEFC